MIKLLTRSACSSSTECVLARAGRYGRLILGLYRRRALVQDDAQAASKQWHQVVDQLRPKVPKLAAFHGRGRGRVLAFLSLPRDIAKNPSINPLKRLNGEIKGAPMFVGIFHNEDAIIRLSACCSSSTTTIGRFSAVAT